MMVISLLNFQADEYIEAALCHKADFAAVRSIIN